MCYICVFRIFLIRFEEEAGGLIRVMISSTHGDTYREREIWTYLESLEMLVQYRV